MIKFPCKCGNIFNLTEDHAGGEIQCPRCGLLADVPSLNDLATMNQDGTFGFSPVPEKPAAPALELDYAPVVTPRVALRYDPETGELIRPMQFKDEQPVPVLPISDPAHPSDVDAIPLPVIPVPTQAKPPVPAIGYAVGDARKQVTFLTLAMELCMPANIAVMFFVFVLFIAAYYITFAIHHFTKDTFEHPWPFLIINLPMWLIIAQTGCVIEHTGPDAVEELPRPLRDFDLSEDVVTPLFHVLLAALICFAPALVLHEKLDPANPMTIPIEMIFAALGCFFFPAIVLTTVTGSVLVNLRPDRLLGVIKQCGAAYIVAVILAVLAAIPSAYYLTGQALMHQRHGKFFDHINSLPLAFPLMAISVYLLHLFCWHLGLMYRENHAKFPWLAQRHIKVERPGRATASAVSK